MRRIVVSEINCEGVADELIGELAGYDLIIFSCFTNTFNNLDPKVLDGVRVTGEFTLKDGLLKIKLSPRRSIKWDITKENVTITYRDDNAIQIDRIVTETEAILRVIVRR